MSFDISTNLDLFKLDPAGNVATSQGSSDAAQAASGSLPGDSISTSPLAYFGDMVQSIGRSMSQDASNLPATDRSAHGDAISQALEMLESTMGLMSLYGASGDEAMTRLQTGDLPALGTID
jgi:hypothetical protein